MCLCLRRSMQKSKPAKLPHSPRLPCTIARSNAQCSRSSATALNAAPARATITTKSTPLRCASIAKRVQIASRSAIAGMSTSRQIRERKQDVDRAGDLERLPRGDDQDVLEACSRLGQARRIERSIVEDRY